MIYILYEIVEGVENNFISIYNKFDILDKKLIIIILNFIK